MFPHLKERLIITSSSDKGKVADNVALVNGTDLSPILERTEIKKVGFDRLTKNFLSVTYCNTIRFFVGNRSCYTNHDNWIGCPCTGKLMFL
jgi:hypothetical protein